MQMIFNISKDMEKDILELASKRGLSKSGLCRYAISVFLEEELAQNEGKQAN